MANKPYMVLLVDRKMARMFTLLNGAVERYEELIDENVPQKVKHGDVAWDAPDKIFRHIQDHLHRHLQNVSEKAVEYAQKNDVSSILIGSHKPLLAKVEKHLPYPISEKVKGKFVTELKAPFNDIVKRATNVIQKIERG